MKCQVGVFEPVALKGSLDRAMLELLVEGGWGGWGGGGAGSGSSVSVPSRRGR